MVLSFRAGCCFFLHIRVWPGAEGILPRPVGAFALYRHSSLHIWRNFRERDMGGQDPVRQSNGGDWPHFLLVVSVSLAVSGLLPADKSGTRVRHMGTSSCIRRCFRALLPVLFFCLTAHTKKTCPQNAQSPVHGGFRLRTRLFSAWTFWKKIHHTLCA